jgi:hypothetical protein
MTQRITPADGDAQAANTEAATGIAQRIERTRLALPASTLAPGPPEPATPYELEPPYRKAPLTASTYVSMSRRRIASVVRRSPGPATRPIIDPQSEPGAIECSTAF